MTRAAAFFDLDKTVIAKSSTLAFGRPLYKEGLISPAIVIKGAYAQLAYQLLGANDARMEKSRVALLSLTKGWNADRVQRLVRETLQEIIDPLIYEEALELFEEHRRAGRDLYLVTVTAPERRHETRRQTAYREMIQHEPRKAARDTKLQRDYKTPVWFSANIHGNEWEGTDAILRALDLTGGRPGPARWFGRLPRALRDGQDVERAGDVLEQSAHGRPGKGVGKIRRVEGGRVRTG